MYKKIIALLATFIITATPLNGIGFKEMAYAGFAATRMAAKETFEISKTVALTATQLWLDTKAYKSSYYPKKFAKTHFGSGVTALCMGALNLGAGLLLQPKVETPLEDLRRNIVPAFLYYYYTTRNLTAALEFSCLSICRFVYSMWYDYRQCKNVATHNLDDLDLCGVFPSKYIDRKEYDYSFALTRYLEKLRKDGLQRWLHKESMVCERESQPLDLHNKLPTEEKKIRHIKSASFSL